MKNDLFNKTLASVALDSATIATGDAAGNIIDTLGFESGKVVITIASVTAGTLDFKNIEESDDSGMSGATLIPADRLVGTPVQLAAANDITEQGYIAAKRFIRLNVTAAGATALVASAVSELGDPETAPVIR